MTRTQTPAPAKDLWADWLLDNRQAGDAAYAAVVASRVEQFADRVLDGIIIEPGMAILDLGAGSGAVGLRAVERWGSAIHVVFADQSARLLRHAALRAEAAGVTRQCGFVRGEAATLAAFADHSFNAVVTRAVLTYLPDKLAAARAIWRVLKPGGVVSIGEPNFQQEAMRAIALRQVFEARRGVEVEPLLPLLCRWQGAQFPDTLEKMAANPMTNFSPQDWVRWFTQAGFEDAVLEEVTHAGQPSRITWDVFVGRTPHPLAPSLREIMAEHFTAEQQAYFEAAFRPRLANDRAEDVRMIYVKAKKPSQPDPPSG